MNLRPKKKKTKVRRSFNDVMLEIGDTYVHECKYNCIRKEFEAVCNRYIRWVEIKDLGPFGTTENGGTYKVMEVYTDGVEAENTDSNNRQYNALKLIAIKKSIISEAGNGLFARLLLYCLCWSEKDTSSL